jgi:hypothetical protein
MKTTGKIMDVSGSGHGTVADSCKHGNEPLGFHKRRGISSLVEGLLPSQEGL